MAITDKFTKVGEPGSATFLANPGYSMGGDSINIQTYVGWPTGKVIFDLYTIKLVGNEEKAADNTRTSWQGIHNGSGVITSLQRLSGNDQNYTAGTGTRVIITHSAHWANQLVDGITAQHKQDGTHGPVTADSIDAPQGTIKESSVPLQTYRQETLANFVASGCIITQTSGLNWSMTAGVVYINGARYTVAAATGSVTASKDTYFDILAPITGTVATLVNTGGNIVANNAASPALAANSIRLAKVVTNGTTITSVLQYGRDSLYNTIRPNGAVGGAELNSSELFGNVRSASNASVINPSAVGDQNFGAACQIAFTVAAPCIALVTVNISMGAVGDSELRPSIYLDGVLQHQFTPSAATIANTSRHVQRSTTWAVPITAAGAHTLSVGAFVSGAASANINAGGAEITALILGKVTA